MIRARVAFAVAVSWIVVLPVQVSANPKSIIELFTSQGCSSCPPADKLVSAMARDPAYVVMTVAIDYWDYLGWKDTLALSGHSQRQRAYAKVRKDREIYTPQAVVNGLHQALGSDRNAIENAIRRSRVNASPMAIPVRISADSDTISVHVAGGDTASGRAEVWLCPTARAVSVAIGRGENKGKTVTYANVVRGWIRLGEWIGQPASFKVSRGRTKIRDADAVTVVVQTGSATAPNLIVGAAQFTLP